MRGGFIMEYEEVLENLYQNRKLNEKGLEEYCGMLKRQLIDLRLKIQDLEFNQRYNKPLKKPKTINI